MPPITTLDDRYELLELVGTCGRCATYRGRDAVLQRDVTVALLDAGSAEPDSAFVARARRLARDESLEVYDGSDRYVVTCALDPLAAEDLARELAPTSNDGAGSWYPGAGGAELGSLAVGRRRPAVGLAAASALLLVLTGLVAAPVGSDVPSEDMPAVMGVFAPQPDLGRTDREPARPPSTAAQQAEAASLGAPPAPPSSTAVSGEEPAKLVAKPAQVENAAKAKAKPDKAAKAEAKAVKTAQKAEAKAAKAQSKAEAKAAKKATQEDAKGANARGKGNGGGKGGEASE